MYISQQENQIKAIHLKSSS